MALRGRDSKRERIYNWRIEGSNDSANYTIIFTAPNPTYLGNMVQHFPVETSNKCRIINVSIIDCTS